ncbi:Hsp70 family protein [Actinoplanes sp. NPDC051411]|uniref:Hsp70 family protein n=1 Tax=Actinoplanes sp. NPDC051411 TaxID=3155522 RepID=UPI003430B271
MLLGVDLGTSHTVAMLRRPDGRTRPLLFDGRPLLPSAVYLDSAGRLHVGPDALRLGHAEPGRLEPHPKRHIDEEAVLLGDAEVPVADLLAAVLGAVAREAVATAGFLPPAVLTYPASWGAPRREVLVGALERAGWPRDTGLIPEPVAAARYFADVLRRPVPVGSSLAVFDFGGGTLDVAVARNDGPHFTVTASGGDDNLGGLDLDAALVDHLGKLLSGGEPQAWRALTTPATLAQWRARREFWESVRGAKEMLSRNSFAPVPVPGVEQAIHLTRDELEAAANPLIHRAVAEARSVIAAAGIAPPDLAGLFLVGGSSRVPLVGRLLHSHLGIAPTVLEQPEFPVAEGATLVASTTAAPDQLGHPSQPSQPSQTGQLGEPDRPGQVGQPGQPGQPGQVGQAGQLGQPGQARPSVGADRSGPPGTAGDGDPRVTRFAPGVATAATPTPTPRTVPTEPPPITDTRADSAPITPTMPGSDGVVAVGASLSSGAPAGDPAASGRPGPISAGRDGGPAAAVGDSANHRNGDEPAASGGNAPRPTAADENGKQRSASNGKQPAARDGNERPPGARNERPAASGGHPRHPAVVPAPRAAGHDDRVYAEPVDPWATGEAAAIAAGGHGLFPSSPAAFHNGPSRNDHDAESGPEKPRGDPGTDGRKPQARRRAYVLMAGAVAALLVIGGVSAWYFWPGYPALDYQTLGLVGRVSAVVPISYRFADAEVIGDRVYFASSDDSGRIGVVATDSDAKTPTWKSAEAGQADQWESMTALPGGVALLSGTDLNSQRKLAVLRAKDGKLAWSRVIGSNDDVYYVGDVAVIADNTTHKLLGLRQSDGTPKWPPLDDPKTGYGSTAVFPATTKKDLDGPATVTGRPLDPDASDDTRIVQVSADRSARVIDAESGKVLTGAPGVAGTSDGVVVNDGRLIVRQSEDTQRIVAYDLGKLGESEPTVLYTAPENGYLSHLTPCGDRICFVEDTGSDAKTDVVTALDLDKHGRAWTHPLARVDGLVPVGSSLLVDNSSQTTLLDGKGKTVWTNGGVAARLDGGNLLEFAKPLSGSSDDPALAGQHLGDQPVQLGPLNDVRTDTCSWNKSVIACVSDKSDVKDFVILRFAK